MGVFGIILNNLRNMKRARKLQSMPREELLAMDDGGLFAAIECVCNANVYDLKEQEKELSREVVIAYTLVKLAAEVNNGGLCQFFVNSSRECAPYVSEALEAIGAVGIREAYDSFVADNGIDVNDLSAFRITRVEEFNERAAMYDFDSFDMRFYEDRELYQQIIRYFRDHVEQIMK